MTKNKKPKKVKQVYNDGMSPDVPLNWDIKKNVEDSKRIKPQDVFVDYKVKKKVKKKR